MTGSAEAGLSAGDVARRLGVAVTTVRTWDRRYGLGPERHVSGRHRRYREDDVARLQLMRRLIADGVTAAEAAQVARGTDRPQVLMGEYEAAPDGFAVSPARARGLYRAAMALDSAALDRMIADALVDGVVPAWEQLICPVMRRIGDRYASTGRFVEVEHVFSAAVSAALARAATPRGHPRVLLACTPDEQHSLPLQALAAALGENGVSSWMLGARVPVDSLGTMVSRTDPMGVVLWTHIEKTADHDALDELLAVRPRPPVVAACGPGWPESGLPRGVLTPARLAQAVELLTANGT